MEDPSSGKSIGSAATLLLATGIGTGVLVLPKAMAVLGMLPMAAMLSLGCSLSAFTTWIIFVAVAKVRAGDLKAPLLRGTASGGPSYAELLALAAPGGVSVLLEVVLLIFGMGAIVSYFLFLSSFLVQLPGWPQAFSSRSTVIGLVAFLTFWPTVFPTVGALAKVASIGPLALAVMAVSIWVRVPEKATVRESDLQVVGAAECAPAALCIAVFAFMWHSNCAAIAREFADPTPARCAKVAISGAVLLNCFYLLIAFGGYLSFGDATADFPAITQLYPPDDPFFVAVRVALSFTLFVAIPVNAYPARESCIGLVKVRFPEYKASVIEHVLIGGVLVSACALIAIVFPDVVRVITVLGGVCCGLLMLVFPAFISRLVFQPVTSNVIIGVAMFMYVMLAVAGLGLMGKPLP